MAPLTLDPNFTLSTALPADMDEIFRMMEVSYYNDGVWKHARKNVPDEELHIWLMEVLAPRWGMPDITTYKIVENASGKIVAWTALQFPWKYRGEEMTPELKAGALDHAPLARYPAGLFMEAWDAFVEVMNSAHSHGYDPEEDYHRKGTMVHPSFQKRGFGTILTRHTNAISQRTGGRTWAPVRPSSHKMFNNEGFKDIAVIDNRTERWGGTKEEGLNWLVRRDEVGV